MKSKYSCWLAALIFAAAGMVKAGAVENSTGARAPAKPQASSVAAKRAATAAQTQSARKAEQRKAKAKAAPKPKPAPKETVSLTALLTADGPPLKLGLTWRIYKLKDANASEPEGDPVWTGSDEESEAHLAPGDYLVLLRHGLAEARASLKIEAGKDVKLAVPLEAGLLAAKALAIQGGRVLEPAFFTVFTSEAEGHKKLGSSSAEPATFILKAGRYELRAEAGHTHLDTPISVEAGKVTSVDMALNVGALDLKTFWAVGMPKLLKAVHSIFPAQSTGAGGDQPLLRIEGAAHRIDLPAGFYRIESVAGLARRETRVAIMAGQVTEQSIVLDAGEVNVAAKPAPVAPETCEVFAQGGMFGIGASKVPLGRAAGPHASFVLPAGRYRIDCRPAGQPKPVLKWEGEVKAGEAIEAAPQA
jgi:hypothetical protein